MDQGYETISTSVEGGIATVTIDRQEVRNALNGQVMRDVRAALDGFREDESVGVVVFTGAGEKSFAAGADISELRERTALDALASGMQRLYDEIEGYEKPTIAAVNGYALGGGCELAMACDIRVAAEHAAAFAARGCGQGDRAYPDWRGHRRRRGAQDRAGVEGRAAG
ncbi:MAG: enoyl-CoA hydratase/isomerase family protein [Rubrobacter sp.]|nr:enoyl-CoA hydratase/isomerase family protein [Rubrobacter sp.]